MGCGYSEAELQEKASVLTPLGPACYGCTQCECEHWAGSCENCDKVCDDPAQFQIDPMYAGLFEAGV